eukprot:scaffold156990_cov31-Tisochrysis_lutea.AAC.3
MRETRRARCARARALLWTRRRDPRLLRPHKPPNSAVDAWRAALPLHLAALRPWSPVPRPQLDRTATSARQKMRTGRSSRPPEPPRGEDRWRRGAAHPLGRRRLHVARTAVAASAAARPPISETR